MLFHISEEPGLERFEPRDSEIAGGRVVWAVSRVSIVPARVEVVDDPITELLKLGVEVRFVPNLWPLRDAVIESSLKFSVIRMRNALPRERPLQHNAPTRE